MTSRTKTLLPGVAAVAVLSGLALAGCGGRSWLEGSPTGSGGSCNTALGAGGAGGAGVTGAGGLPAGKAPTPHCKGTNSQCIAPDGGGPVKGAATIKCDPEPFKGPWNLLLERQILNQFQIVQMQAVQEPGFGATFFDTSGPPAKLTYRVCVVDGYGTRCSDPFTTYGPVSCVCEPFDCNSLQACDVQTDDGCGTMLYCNKCPGGTPCNAANHSCCPPGDMPDGLGGCVCAPPKPCGPGDYWDVSTCSCQPVTSGAKYGQVPPAK